MKEPKAKSSVPHKIKNIVFAVVFVLLGIVMVLTITTRANGGTPSIFGYSIYRVATPSMTPALQVGDVILVKECDPLKLKEGDIITYQGTEGDLKDKKITHRVVEEPYKIGDEYYLKTKGDSNDYADPEINVSQVVGIYQQKLPALTWIYNIFLTPWGLLIIIALIVAAFFGEIVNLIRAFTGDLPEDEDKESIEDIIERIKSQENKEE
ncbi:MAG: signal peptidase I [Ruminococcus sp.]